MLSKPAPSQIFAWFLSARTRLLSIVSHDDPRQPSNDDIVQRLRNCIYAVTSTFFLVFYIFACPSSQPNPKNPKLLAPSHKELAPGPRTLKHAHHLGTHLHAAIPPTPPYFYSILQTIKDDLDSIYKARSIEQEEGASAAFFSLHIPPTSVHTQCSQWLAHSAQLLQAHARKLLSYIDGAQALAHVRDSVRAGLNEVVGTTDLSWSNVCQLVLGHDVDLWDVLCMEPFSSRAREIVAHSFQTMDFDGAIAVLLRTPSAGVGMGLWFSEGGRDEKDIATIQNKAAGLTPSVHEFVRRFDTMLAACLADLAHLTQQPQATTPPLPAPLRPPPSPRVAQSPVKPPVPTVQQQATTQAASTALEMYVQDRCFAGVTSFLETVRKRLEVLQATILAATSNLSPTQTLPASLIQITSPNEEAHKSVDEALLTAQAARALSSYSKQLSAALVPSSVPTPSTPSTPSAPSTPQRKPKVEKDSGSSNARLITIKTTLRQCYLRGYVLWARWVTATHTQWLASFVRRDSWSDTTRRHGWEEHKVMIEGDDGIPMEEKLYLPFQPSPYVLEFLFAVCREIHRAGGHTIHRTALEYLARELAYSVLDLYDEVARTHQGGGASKEGGVQLLCDACFLVDVLSVPDTAMQGDEDLRGIVAALPRLWLQGESELVADPPGSTPLGGTEGRLAQAMAWGRRVDKTVDALKYLLDPIDLAFYEPHVKSFVVRCYQRCSVMFGALVQLHRPQDSQVKVPPIVDHNIIPLAKPIARFGYLPASVPTPTSHGLVSPVKHTTVSTGATDAKEAKKLSFMEQGVGSLKKFTSLNMLSTFASPASPPPQAAGLATTPPKTLWGWGVT